MKIVSYNIQFGRGIDLAVDLVRITQAVRGADIICLQEVEQGWRRSANVDQPAEIAGLLPTHYWVYGSSFDVDASAKAAHGAVINRRRRHGNLILSRWPILSTRTFNLPKQNYPDLFNMQMTFVEATVDTGDETLRVYNYHGGYLDSAERVTQVGELAAVFGRSPGEGGAWSGKADIDGDDWSNGRRAPPMPTSAIVCGDFNMNCETDEYRLLLESTGLVDPWQRADAAAINHSTRRREVSGDIRVWGKIDHIFVTPDLAGRIDRVTIDEEAVGSDHKPVSLELGPPR